MWKSISTEAGDLLLIRGIGARHDDHELTVNPETATLYDVEYLDCFVHVNRRMFVFTFCIPCDSTEYKGMSARDLMDYAFKNFRDDVAKELILLAFRIADKEEEAEMTLGERDEVQMCYVISNVGLARLAADADQQIG